MEEHPESGTVGCRILNEDGSIQWACRRSFPTIVSAVSKTIGLAALFPNNKTLASYNMTYADPDAVTEVDAISGSFFCIRRDVYEKLNGFDEDFFMYGEDLDLCFRTKQMGLKNYYTPVTNILHFKGQSCRTRRWGSYVDFYKAMLIFVRKHKDLYFVPEFPRVVRYSVCGVRGHVLAPDSEVLEDVPRPGSCGAVGIYMLERYD